MQYLCVANLHLLDLDEGTEKPRCPQCGCTAVRAYSQQPTAVKVDLQPYALNTHTWLTDLTEKDKDPSE